MVASSLLYIFQIPGDSYNNLGHNKYKPAESVRESELGPVATSSASLRREFVRASLANLLKNETLKQVAGNLLEHL